MELSLAVGVAGCCGGSIASGAIKLRRQDHHRSKGLANFLPDRPKGLAAD